MDKMKRLQEHENENLYQELIYHATYLCVKNKNMYIQNSATSIGGEFFDAFVEITRTQ